MGSDSWEKELKEIKSQLPSPIAHAVHEVLSGGDSFSRFILLLESIELTARFLALLGAAEILKSGHHDFDKFEWLGSGTFGSTFGFLQFYSQEQRQTALGSLLLEKHDLPQVKALLEQRKDVNCLRFFEACKDLRKTHRGHGAPSKKEAGRKLQLVASAFVEIVNHIGFGSGLTVWFVEDIRLPSRVEEEVHYIELLGTNRPMPEKLLVPAQSPFEPHHVYVKTGELFSDLHPWMVWHDESLFFFDATKRDEAEYKTHWNGTRKEKLTDLAAELLKVAPSLFEPQFWPEPEDEDASMEDGSKSYLEELVSPSLGILGSPLALDHGPQSEFHPSLEGSKSTSSIELSSGKEDSLTKDAVLDSSGEEPKIVILTDPPEVTAFAKMSPARTAYLLRLWLERDPQVVPLKLLLRQQATQDLAKATWDHLAEQHHAACAPHFIQGPRHHIFPPKPTWFPTRVDEGALLANLSSDLDSNGSSWSALLETMENLGPLYRTHRVQKRTGGVRTLHEPIEPLKRAQTRISKALLATFSFHDNATAYVPERSHVHHALQHTAATSALKVDIKDFFGSITSRHLLRAFSRWTFTLPNSSNTPHWDGTKFQFFAARPVRVPNPFANFSREGKLAILKLCLRNDRLPQGAPSSPALANLIAHTLDCKLAALRLKGLTYTRYADDIVISQATSLVQWEPIDTLAQVEHALNHEGWMLNDSKTVFWSADERTPLTICGIRVPGPHQKFPDLSRDLKRKVRAALHATEKARDLDESRGMLAYAYFATGNFAYRMASSSDTARLVENLGRNLGYKDDALRDFVGVWRSVRRPEAPHLGLPKS